MTTSKDREATRSTTTTPRSTSPKASESPILVGEEISVSSDRIEYGDDLVVLADRVASDGDRLYVLAFRVEDEPRQFRLGADRAVLAAFDAVGAEQWRVDLDGGPSDVVVVDGDPWVLHLDSRSVSRISASDGRMLATTALDTFAVSEWMVGAFGSVWIAATQDAADVTPDLVRVESDLTAATVELFDSSLLIGGTDFSRGERIATGSAAVWVPLSDAGVGMVDPDTNELTVIPRDLIGHAVVDVAVDGDVVYVASGVMPFTTATVGHVSLLVDRQVVASTSFGPVDFDPGPLQPIEYMGPLDGAFGVLLADGRFHTLSARDPTVVDSRIALVGSRELVAQRRDPDELITYGLAEVDGEVWIETLGPRNWGLIRVQLGT